MEFAMKFKYYILVISFLLSKPEMTKSWSYNPLCWFGECCNLDDIPANIYELDRKLSNYVYGQHLIEIVVHAISSHWSSFPKPKKALTLSFHGWPGSGKNYVSNFIAESLYKHGLKSNFVHYFVGRIHFPQAERVLEYKENLYGWLKGNISRCPNQLFIFDEVDKMPPGILNAIKPVIDYRSVVDGGDYTQSIFIFLSNTGASLINKQYQDFWKAGKQRDELQLKDFENLIMQGAFNEEGGFYHSDTIKSNLIDHYIPFLPMEEEHVRKCIRDQFRVRNVYAPKEEHIKEILDFIQWGPNDLKIFAKSGCKRISSKVSVIVAKHYTISKKQEL